MEHRKQQGNDLGGSRKSQLKMAKKQVKQKASPRKGGHQLNFQGSEEANMKKKTLQALQAPVYFL